jgi:hypothetical protein
MAYGVVGPVLLGGGVGGGAVATKGGVPGYGGYGVARAYLRAALAATEAVDVLAQAGVDYAHALGKSPDQACTITMGFGAQVRLWR